MEEYLSPIKNYEMKCTKCNGLGYFGTNIETYEINHRGHKFFVPGNIEKVICNFCKGTGIIDWIDEIKGEKNEII